MFYTCCHKFKHILITNFNRAIHQLIIIIKRKSLGSICLLLKRCWPELTIECSVCIEHESFEYLRVEDDQGDGAKIA